jgi:acyl carrier protein
MRKVVDILQEIRPEFQFEGVENFFSEGMLDSFDLVTLVSALDHEYNIHIDGAEILPENFQNAAVIEALVKRHGVNL